ncbi:hypothetical protein Moror_15448, partial [Moniliophthora roreri MCA 2997]
NASTMCLDISLQGVLSADGLYGFQMEGLVRIVALCWTMMMTDTTIMMGSDDWTFVVNTKDERREFLFMGVNSKKVRLMDVKKGIKERMAEGWQPGPSQTWPMMEEELEQVPDEPIEHENGSGNDEMPRWSPGESQDYNSELYGDGES